MSFMFSLILINMIGEEYQRVEHGTLVDVQLTDEFTLVVFENGDHLELRTAYRDYGVTIYSHKQAYSELFNAKGLELKIYYLETQHGNFYTGVFEID